MKNNYIYSIYNQYDDRKFIYKSSFNYIPDETTNEKSEAIKLLSFDKSYDLAVIERIDADIDFAAFIKTLHEDHSIEGLHQRGFTLVEIGTAMTIYSRIYVLTASHAAATIDVNNFI